MKITGPHDVQLDRWIACAPFEKLLQIEIVEAKDGKSTLRMPFVYDFAQGSGLMHGGVLVSLADTAVVIAIKSIMAPGSEFVTTEMQSKFLYPVRQGIVTAEALISKPHGRIIDGRATVFNENRRPVLEATTTFRITQEQVQDS